MESSTSWNDAQSTATIFRAKPHRPRLIGASIICFLPLANEITTGMVKLAWRHTIHIAEGVKNSAGPKVDKAKKELNCSGKKMCVNRSVIEIVIDPSENLVKRNCFIPGETPSSSGGCATDGDYTKHPSAKD